MTQRQQDGETIWRCDQCSSEYTTLNCEHVRLTDCGSIFDGTRGSHSRVIMLGGENFCGGKCAARWFERALNGL